MSKWCDTCHRNELTGKWESCTKDCPAFGKSFEELARIVVSMKEYVTELDSEIDRCVLWLEEHMYSEACIVSEMEGRIHALTEIKSDLQYRLNELI